MPGIGDEDVEAAELSAAKAKAVGDLRFLRHVEPDVRTISAPNAARRVPRRPPPARVSSISASTTQAPSRSSRSAVALPMPPAPPVTSATLPASGFGLRHALELCLLQQPVFDVEGFLLGRPT